MEPLVFHLLITVGGIMPMGTGADPCLPPVDVEAILVSVESFLERQMDRFPPPSDDYPPGFENAQLIQTYDVPDDPDFDRADVYDTSLAAIYFILRGNLERARALLDGILLVQQLDPYSDGRTRAAYRASHLLAGHEIWQCPPDELSFKDPNAAVGNMSWQGIALARFYCVTGEQEYLDAARLTADWINAHARQSKDDGFGGFSLGEDCLEDPIAGTTMGRSTEHNVDVYVLATSLYHLDEDPEWLEMGEHAQNFVEHMYDPIGRKYWLGTKENQTTHEIDFNYYPIPTDGQAWTALAGVDTAEHATLALQWLTDPDNGMLRRDVVCENKTCAESCQCVTCFCDDEISDCCFEGMRFTNIYDDEHIQCEVTAGAAMALCLDEQQLYAEDLLCNLERIRLTAPNADPEGIGIVATPWCFGAHNSFTSYLNERHVASTVWAGLAFMVAQGDEPANPLTLIPACGAIPIVSEWGLLGMALLLLAAGCFVMRRAQRQAA